MHLTISVYKRQNQVFINIMLAVYITLSSQTFTEMLSLIEYHHV